MMESDIQEWLLSADQVRAMVGKKCSLAIHM